MERVKIDRLLQRERRCARFEPQHTSCGRSINRIAAHRAGAVDSGGSSRERIDDTQVGWRVLPVGAVEPVEVCASVLPGLHVHAPVNRNRFQYEYNTSQ